jgi:HEAT repeat protein
MRLETDPGLVLAQEILASSSPDETARLLWALQTGQMSWEQPLTFLLFSPVADLRRAALQVLLDSHLTVADKLELLQRPLQGDNLAILEDAVHCIGDLEAEGAVPALGTLLDKLFARKGPEVTRLQEQICLALGRIGSPIAVPLLRGVLVRKHFLGGSCEPTVRAAAIFGLGNIRTPEARDLVRKHFLDPDPVVSATAKFLLGRSPDDVSWDPSQVAHLINFTQ